MPLNDSKPPEKKSSTMKERFNVLSCIVQRTQLHSLGDCFINVSVKVVFGLLTSISFIEYVLCDR